MLSALHNVTIESVALIASQTKKIKQMTFFYLTDFNLGPNHDNRNPLKEYQSQRDYITKVFKDLISNIRRKAAYVVDSDLDLGKAQFSYYFIKFYKNKEVKKTIDFMEAKLSQLLDFETSSSESGHCGSCNIFVQIVKKIPRQWILKGRKLLDVIQIVHAGLNAEVERVKQTKSCRAFGVLNTQEDYPCVKLQEVYQCALLEAWPEFELSVLYDN